MTPVRARRYIQHTLGSDGGTERELQGEWSGTRSGGGMLTDDGEYVDFGYVFLGGDPKTGTCAYLVTEANPAPGKGEER